MYVFILQRYNIFFILFIFCIIISLHQSQLDINRAVGTSRSRCRGYQRHRCRRYGVREGLLLTPAASPWTCFCGSRCDLAPLLHFGLLR